MTGPVIDLQHSGHAASGSMTGRAGKMSEKQPQPSRTVRKRGRPRKLGNGAPLQPNSFLLT